MVPFYAPYSQDHVTSNRLPRGSNYSDLTKKILLFWENARWWEVVAYEKWLPREVRLFCLNFSSFIASEFS